MKPGQRGRRQIGAICRRGWVSEGEVVVKLDGRLHFLLRPRNGWQRSVRVELDAFRVKKDGRSDVDPSLESGNLTPVGSGFGGRRSAAMTSWKRMWRQLGNWRKSGRINVWAMTVEKGERYWFKERLINLFLSLPLRLFIFTLGFPRRDSLIFALAKQVWLGI